MLENPFVIALEGELASFIRSGSQYTFHNGRVGSSASCIGVIGALIALVRNPALPKDAEKSIE